MKNRRVFTYILLTYFCVVSGSIFSQHVDSTTVKATTDSSNTKKEEKDFKFFFGLDARRSFVLINNSKLNGLKIGLSYRDKHRFGIGVYGMSKPVTFVGEVDKNKHPDASDTVRFNFGYATLFYEYVWFKNKRWDLSTPIHLGIGNLDFSYLDTALTYKPLNKGGAFMSELTGVAQYKIFRWFALGTGVGYRAMLIEDKTIRKSLNSPVYILQVKILFGEIYKMTFRRKKLEEWK